MKLVKTMDANYTDTHEYCGTLLLYSSDESSTVYDYKGNPVFNLDFYLKGERFGGTPGRAIFFGRKARKSTRDMQEKEEPGSRELLLGPSSISV